MRFAALCLITATSAAVPAFAADQWLHLATPHFEMYTDVGERSARDAILYFEQVRSFFTEAAPVRGGVTEFPVRIVIFKNEKQYRPYAMNSFATAYYVGTQWRDYIVMQDADTEHLPAAIHEYMHLIVRHSGLELPVWLNEGWADVYSTLKPIGKKTALGDLIPGRVQELNGGKWLDFNTLTSADQHSPYYNEANRAGMFYSESWALVHMLYLAPDYKQKFPAFVGAILQRKTAAEACQIAYGRSAAQVFADLKSYLTRNQLFGVLFDVKLTKAEEEAVVTPAGDFESGLTLADLLAALNKRDEAQAAYDRLAKIKPDNAEIPQSLGYLAWRNGNTESARAHFEKAFASGADDPQMCFHLASLEQTAHQPNEKIIPPLLRALKGRPDYVDARIELGVVELNAQNYDAAIAAFVQLHNIPAERAPLVFNGMAYAYAQKGDLTSARQQALNARKWDRTDVETRQTDDLIRYIDRVQSAGKASAIPEIARSNPGSDSAPPTLRRAVPPAFRAEPDIVTPGERVERVQGTMKALDCSGDHPRLEVLVEGKPLILDVAEPEKVVLKHDGAATFDFTCGPQKPVAATIEYTPVSGPGKSPAGNLRGIEF
ncbi:MAG TPA: tetratricopeptide repeat protein [Bryobacteraceae bacterium]|nr:tetratricopeptide repeat protein [Bryobacteraceae bacterium]